jgi:hypothetical protein
MHGKYLTLSIVLLLSLFVGCTNGPESPLSTIPMILIDHIEETKETKIFVHGIEDTLFSNITIQINEDTSTENFTYELHMSTSLEKFMLNVSIWDEEKQYEYIGNFTVFSDKGEMKLEVQDIRHVDPIETSLPYTIIVERKE